MCGIAGIIQSSSLRYTIEDIRSMTNALAHRGPDGEGHWTNHNQRVLLGHRRLSILDLTNAGNQPMCCATLNESSSGYRIVHNGEIYNYTELKELLSKKGYRFSSGTDTEVIGAAYDLWKEECVDHFDGMFAFAIWDETRQQLFAARDRFGEKPFYYFFDGNNFAFASEMKALWAIGIPREPNLRMLFNFITIGYTSNPEQPGETFFENIFKLPPSTTLTFDIKSRNLELEQYWELNPELNDKSITEAAATEKFQSLLTTSVKRRLRSDVPVGTSLSGGIDSATISSMASGFRNTHEPFHAFTAIFPGYEKDESRDAKLIADKFGMQHHTITITAEDLLNDWNRLCFHQEEPFGSASIYAQFKVYELAKNAGVKVLLDGQGADEVLAGYSKYYKWYWQELFRNRKLYRSKELTYAKQLGVEERFNFTNMIAAYFPSFATIVLENRYLLRALRHPDLSKDFVKLQSKEAYYTTPDHFTLNGALYFNTCINGLEELLRFADRNAMAHGREVRLPFLSHELVEFIFSLPSSFKIKQGWTKWLLRHSMNDILPTSITWKKEKTGFEPPQAAWMNDDRIREQIREAKKSLVAMNILNKDVIDQPVRPTAAHDADNFDWRYFSAASLFKKA